ncbi:peflin [Anaeramoeba flamelloides]|uniref:Peflin n=1 Tax=Anaeramoeba flamelloides TaxID=1746091 RepID=A0AAV7Z204_9EUKA|nr:peflin [Anaeramoeba flamelloides]KAJ6240438.1 peflin [Anaeramoeba flamelloides]|eukprot:Anaeramoba_flamelloidesa807819_713.p1 GENE.a807819_713~~a807819_713.p1  ORF type:complete len:191 (+),score=47.02 a807819_713:69-641(+)
MYNNQYNQQQQQMMRQQQMMQQQQQLQNQLMQWFNYVDKDRSGFIDSKELLLAFGQGGMNFSPETCSLLIRLFDTEQKGSVNFQQFFKMYNFINQMKVSFCNVDQDNSGNIDANELATALKYSGYTFPNNVIMTLCNKFGKKNVIYFDNWIALCAHLQRTRAVFQNYDTNRTGKITVDFNGLILISAYLK